MLFDLRLLPISSPNDLSNASEAMPLWLIALFHFSTLFGWPITADRLLKYTKPVFYSYFVRSTSNSVFRIRIEIRSVENSVSTFCLAHLQPIYYHLFDEKKLRQFLTDRCLLKNLYNMEYFDTNDTNDHEKLVKICVIRGLIPLKRIIFGKDNISFCKLRSKYYLCIFLISKKWLVI